MDCRGRGQRRFCRVFHDVTHTSVAKDMSVSCRRVRAFPVNQGGTADLSNSSLIKRFCFIKDFLYLRRSGIREVVSGCEQPCQRQSEHYFAIQIIPGGTEI